MDKTNDKVEEMYNEFTKFAIYHRRNGERFVELADKDVKDFLRQAFTSSYEQGVRDERGRILEKLNNMERENEIYVYGSTESIKRPKVGDLKLKVVSMWDFGTKSVCFRTQEKTFGGGTITIPYALERCKEVVSDTHTRWEEVEKVENDVKEHLEKRGYTIAQSTNKEDNE